MSEDPGQQLTRKYRTPRFKYGAIVSDAVRGDVEIVKLSDACIPWPIGKRGRSGKSLVVYGDLERAIQTESSSAVCYWWGVCATTAWKWRRALGVPKMTPGSVRLFRERMVPRLDDMRALVDYADQQRNAKIAESRRGVPRPQHVREALRRASIGRPMSDQQRRQIGERNLRLGIRPPKAGRPWTAQEDELLRTLSAAEVARRTGRTLTAVYSRRHDLKLPDRRRKQWR